MALILLSYGNMAYDIVNTAEMLVNETADDVIAFGVQEKDDPDTISQQVSDAINHYYNDETVYLVFDYRGGIAGNIALNLTQKYPKIHVISGLNLPLVMDYINKKSDEIKTSELVTVSRNSINDVSDYLKGKIDTNDECE